VERKSIVLSSELLDFGAVTTGTAAKLTVELRYVLARYSGNSTSDARIMLNGSAYFMHCSNETTSSLQLRSAGLTENSAFSVISPLRTVAPKGVCKVTVQVDIV